MPLLLNILGSRKTFDGGLYLPDHKAALAKRPIQTLRADGLLHVPLAAGPQWPTTPLVRPGDRVLAGQPLAAAAAPDALHISAPTSGRVIGMGSALSLLDGPVPVVTLEPDGLEESAPPDPRWESDLLLSELAEHGVMCPLPRRPAHALLADAAAAGVTTFIVNAMETEPYLTADLRTLVETPSRVIEVTCDLADALGVTRVILALADRHRRVVRRMEAEAQGRNIEIVPLTEKYPQCHPILLIKTLLDVEVPPGGSMFDAGAIVVPLALIRAGAEALLDGRAVTHAVMTVAGSGVERPGTYRVPVGMSLRRLAERVGASAPLGQMVCGGPLTGVTVTDNETVVTPEMNALLIFSEAHAAHPISCIHCGWCVEDCPVGLEPLALYPLAEAEQIGAADRSRLLACVECGLCGYVCPSELPLAAGIRSARRRIEAERGPARSKEPAR